MSKPYTFSLWDAFWNDYVRHPGIYLFLVPFTVIVPLLLWQGSLVGTLPWFLLGWAVFLPQEYLTHAYIMHSPPPRNGWLYRQLYRLHYGHHDYPMRSDLMYIPLWFLLPVFAGNIFVFAQIIEDMNGVLAAVSGLMAGYLFYEWSHLLYHIPYKPKTRLGKFIKQRHAKHHFNERTVFAVSAPTIFLDYLAGTASIGDAARRNFRLAEDDSRLLDSRAHFAGQSCGDYRHSKLWLRYFQTQEVKK